MQAIENHKSLYCNKILKRNCYLFLCFLKKNIGTSKNNDLKKKKKECYCIFFKENMDLSYIYIK